MPHLAQIRRLIDLFLPVLFPSWRFFDTIGASPRVEVGLGARWVPAVPLPSSLTGLDLVLRTLWNPQRNEALYLTALAERALAEPDGPAHGLLAARLSQRHGDVPYRIWLDTGEGRELVFESQAHER